MVLKKTGKVAPSTSPSLSPSPSLSATSSSAGRPSPSINWEDASSELKRRVVSMLIYGDTATGRTTLALTAPGPIALIHCAEKLEGIVQPHVEAGKEIRMMNFGGEDFSGSPQQVADKAEATLRRVKAAWEDAKGWARTIIIDTDTDLYALLRLARFGKLTQVKPHHYGPVNAEWKGMYSYHRVPGVGHNLILIGKMREEYVNDKPTGVMEHSGQKDTRYDVDVRIRTESSLHTMLMGDKVDWRFRSTIEKAWYGSHMIGEEMEDEMSNFPMIMSAITGMLPGDWGLTEDGK